MSDTSAEGPTPAPQLGHGPTVPGARPPIVRLPTWVNVVLVITLFSSCTAASTAGQAVDQLMGGSGSASTVSEAEVRDLCRLLGALAADQSVDLDAALAAGETGTICATAAREGATP